jgi:DNA-binding Lrp family transcriptional regulator
MADSESRQVTLYVQSKKVVTNFYRPPASRLGTGSAQSAFDSPIVSSTTRTGPDTDEISGAANESYFLSDDQARCAAVVEELGKTRGYSVKLVDVGKQNRVGQFVVEHLKDVDTFPVLISPSGQRIVGCEAFTEEAICELMPAEMSQQRAFTYVKVRGGDLDKIRRKILDFGQVKEVHLLTGDWDVFVVLEFPGPDVKKRQVLDFVTEQIRSIPEVLDTSTLVPEYSISKFP